MNIWNNVTLSVIYTLSPTHCGVGQAMGALDLPIARDTVTNFPILPATSLKGVARDYLSRDANLKDGRIDWLFGKSIEDAEGTDSMAAGTIAFTEGRIVAFPVRSLNRPFLHVTCPLIVERLKRDLRVLGIVNLLPIALNLSDLDPSKVYVADPSLTGSTVVLEDLVFSEENVLHLAALRELSENLAHMLPKEEESTRQRLMKGMVMIPDEDFLFLIQQATSVRARIKLTGGKTTTKWNNPATGEEEKGNLWYEESLPSDCLFISFLGERRQYIASTNKNKLENYSHIDTPMEMFHSFKQSLEVVQLGGNETVGYGLCLWNFVNDEGVKK